MSVVFATKPSHPALLPPTPPTTPPISPPQPTLALPLHGKFGLQTTIPRSPLAKSPITKDHNTATITVVPAPNAAATTTTTTNLKSLAPVASATSATRAPLPCYAMLRAFHATTIRYVISKLRWDQTHSGYIPGCDPWDKINHVIGKLEDELSGVESAQKILDKYPNLSHPIAPHGPALLKSQTYGPLTSEQVNVEIEKERLKELALDKQLFEQFPFLKQAFVGPRTKAQAKAHGDMRKIIFDGEFYMDDLEEMMPEENLKAAMEGLSIDPYRKKPAPAPAPAPAQGTGGRRMRKMTYDEIRLEKEQAKIVAQHKAAGLEPPHSPKKPVVKPKPEGPMTKEEWMSTLPVFGPRTRGEAMLPVQREQRQIILTWLKQPWPVYDEEAAGLMHQLGTLAFGRLERKAREMKSGPGPGVGAAGTGAAGAAAGVAVKKNEKDGKKDEVKEKSKETGAEKKESRDTSGSRSGEKKDDQVKEQREAKEGEKLKLKLKSGYKEEEEEAESEVNGDDHPVYGPENKPATEGRVKSAKAEAEAGAGAGSKQLKLEVEVLEGVEIVDLADKVKLD